MSETIKGSWVAPVLLAHISGQLTGVYGMATWGSDLEPQFAGMLAVFTGLTAFCLAGVFNR